MSEAENDDQQRICELKLRLDGAAQVQSGLLSQYNAMCMMGAYEQAEKLRSQLHDYLDVFLDSCCENSKRIRKMQGL